MKHAKGWEEEEDDYALFVSPSNKKGPKKAFKGCCGYCGEFGHKVADCPNKKSNQNKGQKLKTPQEKKQHGKGDSKGKGHLDMSKINRKCTKDTFKGSLFGCFEDVSNTTLTIVRTINVSIDCDWFQVLNPFTRKNILT